MKLNNQTKIEIYRIIDSFLTEAKNQFGKYRSLEQLNQDRHLAAERLLELVRNVEINAIKAAFEELENVEYDNKTHAKGSCSHSTALCSAIEQSIKLHIRQKKIDIIRGIEEI